MSSVGCKVRASWAVPQLRSLRGCYLQGNMLSAEMLFMGKEIVFVS